MTEVVLLIGEEHEDPILRAYLDFLAEQMKARPELVQSLCASSVDRARELVGGLVVNPDEDLGDEATLV